ncbi:MAG: hypothetical protein WAK91_11615 [Candidatus Acidiferrales bacterium]|jgi:hypothetical protein
MKKLKMRSAGFGLALALLMPPQAQRARVEEFKARFDSEPDPVRKAKLIEKLGDYQFDQIRRQVEAGDLDQSVSILSGYRDECASLHKSLRATGVDPEKRPSGFKQLEFSVRESLTRLQDIMAGLPKDDQKRFVEMRTELEGLDHQLILELFPRQSKSPGKETAKP